MKIKWKSLFDDLKTVFKKHLRPEKPESDPSEVLLLRQIVAVQKQQKGLNDIRSELARLAGLLKNDDVFQELDRLAAMAPKEEAFDKKDFDGYDDIMFI